MKFTIRQARKYAGFTQEKMAESLGIDRSTYIKIEKDVSRATVKQVCEISKITKIPVGNLFLPCNSTNVDT